MFALRLPLRSAAVPGSATGRAITLDGADTTEMEPQRKEKYDGRL
jgi:hypothetical protein